MGAKGAPAGHGSWSASTLREGRARPRPCAGPCGRPATAASLSLSLSIRRAPLVAARGGALAPAPSRARLARARRAALGRGAGRARHDAAWQRKQKGDVMEDFPVTAFAWATPARAATARSRRRTLGDEAVAAAASGGLSAGAAAGSCGGKQRLEPPSDVLGSAPSRLACHSVCAVSGGWQSSCSR
eukprot:scaffold1947_cov207-Prasinococcus_capsulatus_cf.AAC.6